MLLNGPEIVRRREALGLRQKDLAALLDMEPSQLCNYETGKRGNPRRQRRGAGVHPRIGLRIAEALHCELEDITLTEIIRDEPPAQDRPSEAA